MKLLTDATKRVSGWKGIEYRAAFPLDKPPGANFYPPDMDKAVHYARAPPAPHTHTTRTQHTTHSAQATCIH